MSDYIEVLDETDPGSNLVGDTLIHTDNNKDHSQPRVRSYSDPDTALGEGYRLEAAAG